MGRYIAGRIGSLIPAVLLLLFLVVAMINVIPGDIIDLMLAGDQTGNAGTREALAHRLGMDQPLPVRYLDYVSHVARGDLGNSLWTEQPVKSMILERVAPSMQVSLLAIGMGAVLGIAIGVISAVKQDSWIDYVLRSISTLGISVPNFAIATAVVVLPALWWGISPNLKYATFAEHPFVHIQQILLPALVLALGLSAGLMRLTRTTMLDVLRQDYVRTARAKGLTEWNVIIRHAMKNAMIPVITLLGLQIALVLSGSVITETVFAIPGVGLLLINSISTRDYPVVQGVVIMVGVFVMMTNIVVDVSYAWLDPRINFG